MVLGLHAAEADPEIRAEILTYLAPQYLPFDGIDSPKVIPSRIGNAVKHAHLGKVGLIRGVLVRSPLNRCIQGILGERFEGVPQGEGVDLVGQSTLQVGQGEVFDIVSPVIGRLEAQVPVVVHAPEPAVAEKVENFQIAGALRQRRLVCARPGHVVIGDGEVVCAVEFMLGRLACSRCQDDCRRQTDRQFA